MTGPSWRHSLNDDTEVTRLLISLSHLMQLLRREVEATSKPTLKLWAVLQPHENKTYVGLALFQDKAKLSPCQPLGDDTLQSFLTRAGWIRYRRRQAEVLSYLSSTQDLYDHVRAKPRGLLKVCMVLLSGDLESDELLSKILEVAQRDELTPACVETSCLLEQTLLPHITLKRCDHLFLNWACAHPQICVTHFTTDRSMTRADQYDVQSTIWSRSSPPPNWLSTSRQVAAQNPLLHPLHASSTLLSTHTQIDQEQSTAILMSEERLHSLFATLRTLPIPVSHQLGITRLSLPQASPPPEESYQHYVLLRIRSPQLISHQELQELNKVLREFEPIDRFRLISRMPLIYASNDSRSTIPLLDQELRSVTTQSKVLHGSASRASLTLISTFDRSHSHQPQPLTALTLYPWHEYRLSDQLSTLSTRTLTRLKAWIDQAEFFLN